MPNICNTPIKETFTNQTVYPLNWDENDGWVEVYVNGERTRFDLSEIKTLDDQPVTFPPLYRTPNIVV